MAVARRPAAEDILFDEDEQSLLVDVPIEEEGLDDDGGLTVLLGGPEQGSPVDLPFSGNLAEVLSETDLNLLASDLLMKVDEDLASREEWENRYRDGLKLLGIAPEEKVEPWPGAASVYHPVLSETAVAFQANAVMEMCPPSGPAKFKVIGEETSEKLKLGKRVSTELNFQTMERMTEWRPEMERLLFRLPLSGTVLKKVYFDPLRQRPVSKMVPADDFIIQYGASDLETCPRFTHREQVFKSTLENLIDAGFYRDVNLDNLTGAFTTETDDAEDDVVGVVDPSIDNDRFEIFEIHADLVIPGLEEHDGRACPYIVTIETSSQTVLAIRRNWEEGDELYRKRPCFVAYNYLPGLGFYGFGVMHLVGGAAEAATALLRQLIDAGTLSNVPSGFKANNFRVKGDETPVAPGEFRDVDLGGMAIKDALLPLPYREPSATSFALLQDIVAEARRVASVADMKIAEQNSQAPVGTTLALLERSLRVMSAVHARLHQSLKVELNLIAGLVRDHMGPAYEYDQELKFNRQQDFGGPIDIIPVSDPNSSTQAQRVIVYQAAVNIAAQAPQVYDVPRLHRGMLEVLGIAGADKIVPLPEDMQPVDPVSENMAILTGKPVRAFIEQDHEAHLRVHMAALQDPKLQGIVGQSPAAQAILSAAHAHIQEHVAFAYRREIERKMGVPLPPPNEPLPSDTEALIANLAAAASEQLIQDHIAEAKAAMIAQQMNDPVTQLEINEQRIEEEDSVRDAQVELEKLAFKKEELALKFKMHREKLASDEAKAGLQARVALDRNNKTAKAQAQSSKDKRDTAALGAVSKANSDRSRAAAAKKPPKGKK